MKSPLRLLGFLFVLLTLTGGAVWAATQNALVTGSVFDQNGAAVPGATVRLLNASIGFSQTLQTDANGNYTFGSVPPAENYVMSVEISGFATVIRPGLSVAVGEAKLVLPPFILQPAAQRHVDPTGKVRRAKHHPRMRIQGTRSSNSNTQVRRHGVGQQSPDGLDHCGQHRFGAALVSGRGSQTSLGRWNALGIKGGAQVRPAQVYGDDRLHGGSISPSPNQVTKGNLVWQ